MYGIYANIGGILMGSMLHHVGIYTSTMDPSWGYMCIYVTVHEFQSFLRTKVIPSGYVKIAIENGHL